MKEKVEELRDWFQNLILQNKIIYSIINVIITCMKTHEDLRGFVCFLLNNV